MQKEIYELVKYYNILVFSFSNKYFIGIHIMQYHRFITSDYFFFNCYTSHKDFSSSLFFLSFLSFLSPFFLRAVCLYDVGRLLIVPEFCPPTVLERPASQMSFLEQFLKETSLRRQGSLESEEGDVEDNRAPSVPSIASSHSFVSQVGLVHETIGF